jgi:hypothetical protein
VVVDLVVEVGEVVGSHLNKRIVSAYHYRLVHQIHVVC